MERRIPAFGSSICFEKQEKMMASVFVRITYYLNPYIVDAFNHYLWDRERPKSLVFLLQWIKFILVLS